MNKICDLKGFYATFFHLQFWGYIMTYLFLENNVFKKNILSFLVVCCT